MISIIVLHHDKAAYSEACLSSLLRSSARPLEVLNVDNGSRDDTPRILDEWETQARATGIETQRLNFETNIGAIRGRNEALKLSRGEHLVFLDNDTLVAQPDWLQQLHDFLDEDAARWIVAPKMLFPWAPFQIECCGCAVTPRGRIQYLGRGQERDAMTEPFRVQCAISAAWMMTRESVNRVGLLDEIYSPVQYEDLDFCYRARELGGQVWVDPRVEIYHFEHTTTAGSGDINFKYVTTKNGVTFKTRWSPLFSTENGATEDDARWLELPKHSIEEIDWQTLLPKP